jgi:hypothetical protein
MVALERGGVSYERGTAAKETRQGGGGGGFPKPRTINSSPLHDVNQEIGTRKDTGPGKSC